MCPTRAVQAAWAAWAGRETLPADRRRCFDRQAERLASGEDVEAWTHPQNGVVVPSEDRPRVFGLGLQHLGDGTSRTLRGGVMYAVAKHYRIPPPLPGTEYAAIVVHGPAAEDPGRDRVCIGSAAIATAAAVILGRPGVCQTTEDDSIERWEREYPEECAKLRDRIAQQINADVGGRKVSKETLRLIGRAQYRQIVLQRIRGAVVGFGS